MKKKSSPGRDGSRGSNDRSRPATGRGKFTRNDNSGDRPARSEKKSPWDSFDNDRPSRGERSSESGERGGRVRRTESGERSTERGPDSYRDSRGRNDSSEGAKRPYQRREENGESRAPFSRGRSDSNDGEKRPYKRREDSGESRAPFSRGREDRSESGDRRAPFTRGRSDSNDGEKRPYRRAESGERRAESFGEKRSYQKREDSSERGEGRGMYQRRSESAEGFEGKRPYKRRDENENTEGKRPFKRSEFGEQSSENSEGKRPYKRRDDSEGGLGEKRSYQRRDDNAGGFGGKRSFQRDEKGEGSSERRPYSKRPPSREDRHARFEEKSSYRDRPSYGKSGGRRGAPRKRNASAGADLSGEIRLNRFIGMAGICSRREADDLITAGVISVNGKVATELGMKVKPGDDIRYNGERIRNEKHVYLLLNKPKDYITTSDDPNDRKTVMELIAGACPERVYPVGRLDRNTVGLLLFTNDGDLARHLTHPSSRVKKIYQAVLDKNFKVADARRLQEGIELEDGISSVDQISIGNGKDDKKTVGVELHSGKNRIVRRMFEALGYEVEKLDRVEFAGLTKKDLPRGRWRMLDEREVGFLKMMGTGKKKQAE